MGALFESPPGSLLTSNMRPSDRYSTHKETISGRLEQMYSPSDTGLGMAWGGLLLTSVSNKRRRAKLRLLFKSFPGPLLKSGMGPLARYSNHQEIINRRPEQIYTSFDTRLEWPREGPLFELDLNKRWAQNWTTIRGSSQVIIEVWPTARGQMWHLPGNHK